MPTLDESAPASTSGVRTKNAPSRVRYSFDATGVSMSAKFGKLGDLPELRLPRQYFHVRDDHDDLLKSREISDSDFKCERQRRAVIVGLVILNLHSRSGRRT